MEEVAEEMMVAEEVVVVEVVAEMLMVVVVEVVAEMMVVEEQLGIVEEVEGKTGGKMMVEEVEGKMMVRQSIVRDSFNNGNIELLFHFNSH